MKREAIIAKFPMIQLQSLVNAKKLFLISNDFTSLKQVSITVFSLECSDSLSF